MLKVKPKKDIRPERIGFACTAELAGKLKRAAAACGVTVSEYCFQVLTMAVDGELDTSTK